MLLTELDDDSLTLIFSQLFVDDRYSASLVCKDFNLVIKNLPKIIIKSKQSNCYTIKSNKRLFLINSLYKYQKIVEAIINSAGIEVEIILLPNFNTKQLLIKTNEDYEFDVCSEYNKKRPPIIELMKFFNNINFYNTEFLFYKNLNIESKILQDIGVEISENILYHSKKCGKIYKYVFDKSDKFDVIVHNVTFKNKSHNYYIFNEKIMIKFYSEENNESLVIEEFSFKSTTRVEIINLSESTLILNYFNKDSEIVTSFNLDKNEMNFLGNKYILCHIQGDVYQLLNMADKTTKLQNSNFVENMWDSTNVIYI